MGDQLLLPNGKPPMQASVVLFSYAGVHPATSGCFARDAVKHSDIINFAQFGGDALIDRSRSRVASDFLRGPVEEMGDVLVMIDHDMEWAVGDVVALIDKAREVGGVVAGVYSKKSMGGGAAVRLCAPGRYDMETDEVAPCTYVSTGFMAIPRAVLEGVRDAVPWASLGEFWTFFLPVVTKHPDGETEELSEDWAFCLRARAAGFPVYAHLRPTLIHHGDYGYRVIDGELPPRPDQAVAFVVNPDAQHPMVASLLADTAEYTKIAPADISSQVSQARALLNTLWLRGNGVADEAAWYRRDDVGRAYILDLVGWHTMDIPQVLDETFGEVKAERVLDFGAGVGTMALMLDHNGANVDVIEPNDALADFIAWRSERHGLAVQRVDAPDGLYDTIVCWHVLEHLPDPEEAVATLLSHLAPDGVLITDSDFERDANHQMHHERPDTSGADLWEAAGMRRTGTYRWERAPVEEPALAH